MNKNETQEYIKNLSFELKDKNKTKIKYKDYKQEKFNLFLNNNKEDIKILLSLLKAKTIQRYKYNSNDFYKNLDLNKKSNIQLLKTHINNLVYEINYNFIKSSFSGYLNNNENKNFSILFYLKYYNTINDIMFNILKTIVMNYFKKGV